MFIPYLNHFRGRLLRWYHRSARKLPWREIQDPYKIWISEIMLQQTQVQTVIPYYKKWVKRFPTVQSLAKARLSEILKYWAGLGYYRRAQMLHQTAKLFCKKHDGKIPRSVDKLSRLPGIGPYTAGAITSIAFGEQAAILDGNVKRILTRIFAISHDIQTPRTLDRLWKLSAELVPKRNPGDFNQAMMELGAMICLSDAPLCRQCPVALFCKAHKLNRETDFPFRRNRIPVKKVRQVALVLHNNRNEVLIKRQPDNGRWGGLWAFPFGDNRKEITDELKLGNPSLKQLMTLRFGFTKYQVQLKVYENQTPETSKRNSKPHRLTNSQLRWVKPNRLRNFAFPSPHGKIVDKITG